MANTSQLLLRATDPSRGAMYQADGIKTLLTAKREKGASRFSGVGSTAILLGITSMLTDISSEMVSAILPLYLVFSVGLSPLAFGTVDGLYQGASALVRVLGGFASDKWSRHKEVAASGYALSTFAKLGIVFAGTSGLAITVVVLFDRIGKGIRTGPRDALISLTAPPGRLGYAFGVHRALDTFGALLGPLVAFGLLSIAPGSYDMIFVISFLFGLLGLSVLMLFVRNAKSMITPERVATMRTAVSLLGRPSFRRVTVIAALLGLTTISDAFVYLALQKRLDFAVGFIPLLYVGTAASFTALAIPFGRIADRVGRLNMFFAGYAVLPIVYTSLLFPVEGLLVLIVYLTLLGMYYAATDGVLMAYAGPLLPEGLRASGLSILTTASALAKLLASILFGAVWTFVGLKAAVVTFGAALLLILAFSILTLWSLPSDSDSKEPAHA